VLDPWTAEHSDEEVRHWPFVGLHRQVRLGEGELEVTLGVRQRLVCFLPDGCRFRPHDGRDLGRYRLGKLEAGGHDGEVVVGRIFDSFDDDCELLGRRCLNLSGFELEAELGEASRSAGVDVDDNFGHGSLAQDDHDDTAARPGQVEERWQHRAALRPNDHHGRLPPRR